MRRAETSAVCPCRWPVFFALGCSMPIQHGLDETAANEILTSLERAGISASKSRDDDGALPWSWPSAMPCVPWNSCARSGFRAGRARVSARSTSNRAWCPRPPKSAPATSRRWPAKSRRRLENVEGVVSARVHLVLPEPDPLADSLADSLAIHGKPRVAAQAAVLLKTRAGRPAPIGEQDVRKLVAGSVPGLDMSAVAVVVTPAPEIPAASGANLVAFGPLRMTVDSRITFVFGLAALCTLLALLAGLVLVLSRRLSAAQRNS
jgi:type III secretion protein J